MYKFNMSLKTEIHLLRHFDCIDNTYRKLLKVKGYRDSYINVQMEIPGSKFNSSVIEDPRKLMEFLEKQKKSAFSIKKNKYNDKLVSIILNVDEKECSHGIGFDCVVEIDEDNSHKIEKDVRDMVEINTIKLDKKLKTWQINIIAQPIACERGKKYNVITAFPGILTPPLPVESNSNHKNFDDIIKFWENHAFVNYIED